MTKEEIGRIIKESRIFAGLTQSQVAEALGRTQNVISAWEMADLSPTPTHCLNCSKSWDVLSMKLLDLQKALPRYQEMH